ncbi:hypothetical protein D9M72_490870 [compost metagenome]
MVRAVDPGRVVDGVGIQDDSLKRCFNTSALGHAQVSAFSDHFDAKVASVDADGVVRFVSHLGMRFGTCLHVRSNAAVVQQVRGRQENGS